MRDLIDSLERESAPVLELRRWLAERERAAEVRAITPSDLAWPRIAPVSIEEHLTGGERPFLSCAAVEGRAYALSAAQREVIREWFNMTASQEVLVEMLATFPGQPTIIREIVLRSEVHVDPANLRLLNGPRKITIDRWGDFCSAAKAREVDREQQRQVDVLASRIAKLIKTAKDAKPRVRHNLTTTGLAFEWHAVVQQKEVAESRKLDSGEVRDILRDLLLARGESGLVALVKEPSFAATSAAVREMDEQLGAEMDRVLKALSAK